MFSVSVGLGRNLLRLCQYHPAKTKAVNCSHLTETMKSEVVETKSKSMPFGVYIHWPYCARKCTYCNFNKYVVPAVDQERMVKSILTEWRTLKKMHQLSCPTTIFFGGGTPSLMKPHLIEKILREISGGETVEISLEANPADVRHNVADFKSAGITRLSLGIQSFQDRVLQLFNRDHDAMVARQSLDSCLEVFRERLSVDLMFGAPGQDLQDWIQHLREVTDAGVMHVSSYQLTVEKGTRLEKDVREGRQIVPAEDVMADMYLESVQYLEKSGLFRYEVSNFSAPGLECLHNTGYWSGKQYLGLGPGSHSRVGLGSERLGCVNHPLPDRWMRQVETMGHGVARQHELDSTTSLGELIATGLRTRDGIRAADWDIASNKEIDLRSFTHYLDIVNREENDAMTTDSISENVQDEDERKLTYGSGLLAGLVWSNDFIRILPSHLSLADTVILNVYSKFTCFSNN